MTVRPIILSHKRAGSMTTQRYFANVEVCVPAAQADDYADAYPQLKLLVHPDEVLGLWAKREWVRLNVGDHIQLDDDSIGIYRIYRRLGGWKKSVLGPDRAYDLIQATADRARAHGAFYYGFAPHAHPLTFNGLHPFRYGGYTPGGAIGLLKGWKGFWPTDTTLSDGDDYWGCCINYHFHRYAFFDRRFAAAFRNTYVGAGGLNEFRAGMDDRLDVLKYLQDAFGADVVVRNYAEPNVATKHIKNPVRRSIVMPYRS